MFIAAGARVIGIDAELEKDGDGEGTSFETGAIDHAERLCGPELYIMRADSQKLTTLPGEYDLVHVDGDHSYRGTMHDLHLAAKATRLILGDDYYTWPHTGQACRDFAEKHGWTLRPLDDKQALLFRP